MGPQNTQDKAAGAGYERLMQRLKSDAADTVVAAERSSFASEGHAQAQAETRTEFGKRRVNPLAS